MAKEFKEPKMKNTSSEQAGQTDMNEQAQRIEQQNGKDGIGRQAGVDD